MHVCVCVCVCASAYHSYSVLHAKLGPDAMHRGREGESVREERGGEVGME